MYRVLLIDDDRDLCALIRQCALADGMDVEPCHSGREGLEQLRRQAYQLVVLDLMLPGMDGFAVLDEIRAASRLPVLMLTARDDSSSKVRGLRAGADDYLTKPFLMEELTARMASPDPAVYPVQPAPGPAGQTALYRVGDRPGRALHHHSGRDVRAAPPGI